MYILLAAVCLTASGCQFSSKQRQAEDWKALNDTIAECSQKIANIVGVIQQGTHTTEETQKQLMHDIDSIDRRMKQAIRNCMERNKDNDLGQYLRENYKEE
jgi:hypothetical protein